MIGILFIHRDIFAIHYNLLLHSQLKSSGHVFQIDPPYAPYLLHTLQLQHAVWILDGQDRLEEMFIKAGRIKIVTPTRVSEQRVEVT